MITFKVKPGVDLTLNDAEHRALIQIGSPSSLEAIPLDAHNGLLAKGVTFRREDGSYDLTDLGEAMYDYVKDRKKPCATR